MRGAAAGVVGPRGQSSSATTVMSASLTLFPRLGVPGLMIWAVARSKTLDKIALHSTISSTNATSAQLEVKVGDKGVALTRLALVGNAEINGKSVEVKSAGAFINAGTPIRVKSVSEALITVVADED